MKILFAILIATVILTSCHKKEQQCEKNFTIVSQEFDLNTRELAEEYEQQIISIEEYESKMRQEIYKYEQQLLVIKRSPKCEGTIPQSTFDYLEKLKLSL